MPLIALVWIQIVFVTMVYGPIAAFLVEYFPARIRYTSLSIPYHIGNGWFGGFLPLIAAALLASTGNLYAGLIYPIVVALITVVVGGLFIRETRHVKIWDEVGGETDNVRAAQPTGSLPSPDAPEPVSWCVRSPVYGPDRSTPDRSGPYSTDATVHMRPARRRCPESTCMRLGEWP